MYWGRNKLGAFDNRNFSPKFLPKSVVSDNPDLEVPTNWIPVSGYISLRWANKLLNKQDHKYWLAFASFIHSYTTYCLENIIGYTSRVKSEVYPLIPKENRIYKAPVLLA